MFSVTVFYDERVVIVAEQRPDASEEDSFQWMSRVLQVNQAFVFFHSFSTDKIVIIIVVIAVKCVCQSFLLMFSVGFSW